MRWPKLLWFLIVLIGLMQFSSVPKLLAAPRAQGAGITLADYWQTLAATQKLLQQLADPPDAAAQAQLNAAAERLLAIQQVQWPNGTTALVDHRFLASQLRAQPPNLPQLRGWLNTLLALRTANTMRPFATVDSAILARILARPEFKVNQVEPPPWLKWLGERWQRLLAWLNRLLQRSEAAANASSPTATLLEQAATLVMLVVLAALLGYALRAILADFVAESALAREDELAHEPLTADSALRRAQELSSGGDYRAAVRYLYLSTLLRLEERGVLRYDRSLTNREYIKRVAHDPPLAAVLRDVVDVFDRVWYGYQPLDASAYQNYARAVEALKNY